MWFPALFILLIFNSIPNKWGIDKEFKPYVEKVYELSNGNLDGRKFHINFGEPIFDGKAAICYPWKVETVVVREVWKRLSEKSKILLIAHEITHCMSKKWIHIKGKDDRGCNTHYMNGSSQFSWCSDNNFDKYVKQMREI